MKKLDSIIFKLEPAFVNSPAKETCAEFFGTLFLVVCGDGIMATATLGRLGSHGVIVGGIGWGLSLFMAVAIAGSVSGGHVNPAVTLALATVKKCPWKYVPLYMLAQYLGAFIGAAIVYMVYYDAIVHFDNGQRQLPPHPNSTAQIFSTYPNEFASIVTCFLDQVVGTALLQIAICAAVDKRYKNAPPYFQPTIVGIGLIAIVLGFGHNCGGALNPARDLGPRFFTLLAGWGTETFTFRKHMWFWVPVLGPHVGGVIGVWLYSLFIDLRFVEWPITTKEEDLSEEPRSEHEDQK